MFKNFLTKFTCTRSQLPDVIKNIRVHRMKPLLGIVDENECHHLKNLRETKNACKIHPDTHMAIKLSSFSIADNFHLARESVWSICDRAVKHNVCILVDAENYHIQDKINELASDLMHKYNKDRVHVYKTYQCYRKDCVENLIDDIERSNTHNYNLGIKLVRGAYYNQDCQYDILFDNIEETHENYDKLAELLFNSLSSSDKLMIATHNEESINKCLKNKHLLADKSILEFSQLMGMSDDLSKKLAKDGNKVYKYIPYGDLWDSLPYLIRRLYENVNMMKYFTR